MQGYNLSEVGGGGGEGGDIFYISTPSHEKSLVADPALHMTCLVIDLLRLFWSHFLSCDATL